MCALCNNIVYHEIKKPQKIPPKWKHNWLRLCLRTYQSNVALKNISLMTKKVSWPPYFKQFVGRFSLALELIVTHWRTITDFCVQFLQTWKISCNSTKNMTATRQPLCRLHGYGDDVCSDVPAWRAFETWFCRTVICCFCDGRARL